MTVVPTVAFASAAVPPVAGIAATTTPGSADGATVSPTRPSASWVATTASRTGIPARVLQAYGAAPLDGDTTWDPGRRPDAVRPDDEGQWGRSAAGGVPDPSHIDDAALTAAVCLCAAGQDMGTPTGWTAAVVLLALVLRF